MRKTIATIIQRIAEGYPQKHQAAATVLASDQALTVPERLLTELNSLLTPEDILAGQCQLCLDLGDRVLDHPARGAAIPGTARARGLGIGHAAHVEALHR